MRLATFSLDRVKHSVLQCSKEEAESLIAALRQALEMAAEQDGDSGATVGAGAQLDGRDLSVRVKEPT
jgi:hypothetical protein